METLKKKTQHLPGGIIRTVTERSVTRWKQKEPPKEKYEQKNREENEVKKIAGLEVDKKTYADYVGRKYDIPGEGKKDYRVVEIYANSEEVAAAHPELHRMSKEILEQIRSEILEARKATPEKHISFAGYIEDLQKVYAAAAGKRSTLKQEYESSVAKWEYLEKNGETEAARLTGKAELLKAKEAYAKALEDLQAETGELVEGIRQNFESHVEGFYRPDGAKINQDTISLLNSGVRLTEAEIAALVEDNRGNPTMLRIIGERLRDNRDARIYSEIARSNGMHEREAFEIVADKIGLAVSSDEVSARVWNIEGGFFDKISSQAIEALNQRMVKPTENSQE